MSKKIIFLLVEMKKGISLYILPTQFHLAVQKKSIKFTKKPILVQYQIRVLLQVYHLLRQQIRTINIKIVLGLHCLKHFFKILFFPDFLLGFFPDFLVCWIGLSEHCLNFASVFV